MKSLLPIAALLLLTALPCAADVVVADHACVDKADDLPKEALDKARARDVLFGHQSVGGNVLEGLAALAEQDGERWGIERAEDPDAAWFGENNGLGDFYVGENEDPMRKIADFRERAMGDLGGAVDVAMFKLCFVDLPEGSRPKEVFEAARKAIEDVERVHPKLDIVWWTCPIETGGNEARNEYNRLVRSYCRKNLKPLFDIADIESNGEGDAMKEDYTDDGGHLDEDGRARAARAFWWLLASLATQPGDE
ncbi:MAG: SGNH/GDSL hydrolase family protein [Planctomycetota bacterium]